MHKSLFITFEGGEGSGKSTQISVLKKHFADKGLKTEVFREPGSTTISEQVREILLHHNGEIAPETELFLYCAARTQMIAEKLRPALENNDVVICDRYADSTLVYQGYALGLGIDKIKQIVDYGMCGIVPDVTFFLDVEPEVGLSRLPGEKDRIEQRELSFHAKLREGYRLLAENEPDRFKRVSNLSIAETTEKICMFVEEKFAGK